MGCTDRNTWLEGQEEKNGKWLNEEIIVQWTYCQKAIQSRKKHHMPNVALT